MQFCLPIFLGHSPKPPQNQFFKRLKLGRQFFYISRYLTDKLFDIVLGTTPLQKPVWNGQPKIQFFERLNPECQFFVTCKYLRQKYFHIDWAYLLYGKSPNGPKN